MSTLEHIVAPEEVMAYLDGELSGDRARAVHAHLSDCTTCQSLAADLRGVSGDLSTWEVETAPATLRAPDARGKSTTRYGFWASMRSAWPHASAAAAVVLVIAGAILITTSRLVPRSSYSVERPDLPQVLNEGARGEGTSVSARPAAGGAGGTVAGRGRGARAAAVDRSEELSMTQLPGAVAQTQPVYSQGQKIIRTVTLTIVTKDFAGARPAIERVLGEVAGFVGTIEISGDANAGSLNATLRVPAARLDDAVGALRRLGRVTEERQSGDEVTEQVRDLEARLTNSRNTERRLNDVLRTRTGRVSDVLEVEREIARVREEIERMEAVRTNLERRVAYATITLQVNQERQATLDMGPLPISSNLRNAVVDGMRGAFESAMSIALWTLRVAPTLLLWVALLWWPVRLAVRRARLS